MRRSELRRGLAEADDELERIEHSGAALLPDPSPVERRVKLGLHLLAVEHAGLVAIAFEPARVLVEARQLVVLDRDVENSAALEVAVDPVALGGLGDGVEVLQPESLQLWHLVGKARQPVVDPVSERGHDEAAVAAAGGAADTVGVEHDDASPRRTLERLNRGPKAAEPGADDRQVTLDRAVERRRGCNRGAEIEPVRDRSRPRHRRRGRGRLADCGPMAHAPPIASALVSPPSQWQSPGSGRGGVRRGVPDAADG